VSGSRKSFAGLVLLVLAVSAASQWWVGHHDRRLGAQVAALAQPGDIQMLGSETCAFCGAARVWFHEHRVPYSECVIEHDTACRAAFDAAGAPGTPVLVVRGRPQLGFSPEQLHAALQRAG